MAAINSRPRILLVDDDEDDYLIIRKLIAKIPDSPFDLNWCDSFEEAVRLIALNNHDLYLVDYRLGANSGLDLLEMAEPHSRSEPFIILTGAGDRDIEQTAMKLGAADYLVKGMMNTELLARSLRYALQRKQIEGQRLQHLIELNRAKDEFISLASHQLRTPATGVKQYVGMLLEGFVGTLTDRQRNMLRKAYESNERQLRIVSDLLKVAQVDAGKVMLRRDEVNINELVDDVLHEQQNRFLTRKQRVVCEHSEEAAIANIDRDTIRMVFENIIDNASKYSANNTTITVAISQDDGVVRVRITDQGVGIAKRDQAQLFQKFARIDNPRSTLVGGSGLGLYWAKKIIDLHDGDITVTSKIGTGTTFEVSLPRRAHVSSERQ